MKTIKGISMGNDDTAAKQEFYDQVKPLIERSDVINFDSKAAWYKIHFRIGYWGIRRHQKRIFGRLGRWRDTHTMVYLDDDHCLSVEPPKCRWWALADLYDERITVWRYTKRTFSDQEMEVMFKAAEELIGTKYDIGQLLDIMINEGLGYPNVLHYSIFDAAKSRKVCSVGARMAYEKVRKHLEAQGDNSMQRLFSTFKDPAWALRPNVPDMNTQMRGVDIEATAPGHFANSHFFDDEFELIAEFDHGRQIYPSP
ncbi:MAG: hypothetical protein JRJ87_19290 [Deltaproteobacteria bacterium]|nr:hypothetical protein [Deltaproteobacteria bacterium]